MVGGNGCGIADSMANKLKWWQRMLHQFGFYDELVAQLEVLDTRGLHYRRSAEVIKAVRRFPTYGIFIRFPSRRPDLWADARSITSLLSLGVHSYQPEKGEKPPVVEVKISGFNPARPLRNLRQAMQEAPFRYQNIYEWFERKKRPSQSPPISGPVPNLNSAAEDSL